MRVLGADNIKEMIRQFIAMAALIFGLFVYINASAQTPAPRATPLTITSSENFYTPLVGHSQAFIDQRRTLTLDDVINTPQLFAPVDVSHLDFGLTEGRVWLKITIENQTERSGPWRLDIGRQYIESLELYRISADGTSTLLMRHGEMDSFDERPLPSRLLSVDIDIKANETLDLILSYTSSSTTFLAMGFGTPAAVVNEHGRDSQMNDLLNGALAAMIGLALLLLPAIGWRISVSFAAYIFAGFLYVFHADGYSFQYIFPNQPWLNDPLNLAFMLAMSAAGLGFMRQLFSLKTLMPRFDKFALSLLCLCIVFALFAFAFINVNWLMIVGYFLVPLSSCMQITTAILVVRKKISGSIPYLIGSMMVVASLIYATAAHLVPGQFNMDATLDFGHWVLVIECFVFATAIMLRIFEVRRERDNAVASELALARHQLELSKSLEQSQQAYNQARLRSQEHKARLSAVSHDLQQPLLSLKRGLESLHAKDKGALEEMYAAFDFLESLATNQLREDRRDRSHEAASSGNLETFPLTHVLDNVKAIFSRQAADKGLEFVYSPTDDPVTTDPMTLMRVVSNLVSNAVKHTQTGQISLSSEVTDAGTYIRVSDSGIGMNEDDLKRYRHPYEKGHSSDGEGLGLSLVQDAAKSMGYEVTLSSKPAEGTTCEVFLPHKRQP